MKTVLVDVIVNSGAHTLVAASMVRAMLKEVLCLNTRGAFSRYDLMNSVNRSCVLAVLVIGPRSIESADRRTEFSARLQCCQ